jgi:DNA-binding transcriptional regulator GbsR (MarR family)
MLEEAETLVIDAIAETMDLYGVTPTIGRLYGVMYMSEDPMTLDEMSSRLGMSKPRMSTGVHSLMEIQMIQKVWRKGERKDLYEAEKDFFKTFVSFFCKKWEREIIVNLEAIEKSMEKLQELAHLPNVPETIRERAQKKLLQLEESTRYYQWLRKLVHACRTKDIFQMIEEHVPEA